ncbi:hypothetical protein F5Y13DRAFT_198117 [Hypoxylon sp. FL1857]|nr:hypothetical protein F5Y13DRAFT_198117 [Hypoxylon sp. FL1857]
MEQDGPLKNGSNSEHAISNSMPAIRNGSPVADGYLSGRSHDNGNPLSDDTSTSRCHTSLDGWLGSLTKAIHAAWPRRHVTYSDVYVLMFSWVENDIPNLSREIARLESIFRDGFSYKTRQFKIPTSKADFRVRKEVDSFIEENDQPDNLLIVYYAGHAILGTHKDSPPIWYSKNPAKVKTAASFDTANIQPILTRAQDDSPDILLIYDCCHAAHSPPRKDKPSRAVVECLFAGGSESSVPIAGPDSFTAALTNELGIAAKSRIPISVVDLHQRIIRRLQSWAPTPIFYEDGRVLRDKDGNIILTVDNRITPVYMVLSTNEEPRTIFLAPKQQVSHQAVMQRPRSRGNDEAEDAELPRVLLAVRLIDDNKEHERALERWLLKAPRCVVKFEKIYQSYSKLLLVELPLPIWDLLPHNPAVTFIDFTKSTIPVGPTTRSLNDNLNAYDTEGPQEYEVFKGELPATKSGSVENVRQMIQPSSESTTDQALPNTLNTAHTTFDITNTDEKEGQRLVAMLNAVDRILPAIFNHHETDQNQYEVRLEWFFDRVLENLNEFQEHGRSRLFSNDVILQHKSFLLRYIGARHLIRYDQPWLDVSNRLTGPLARVFNWNDNIFNWENDDERADAASIPEKSHPFSEPSTHHSKSWSSSGRVSSRIDSTATSIEVASQKNLSDFEGDELSHSILREKEEPQPESTANRIPASKIGCDTNKSQACSTVINGSELWISDDTQAIAETAFISQSPIQDGPPHGSQGSSLEQDTPRAIFVTSPRSSELLTTVGRTPLSNDASNEEQSDELRRGLKRIFPKRSSAKQYRDLDYPSDTRGITEHQSLVYDSKETQPRGTVVPSEATTLVESTKSEYATEIASRPKSVSFDAKVDYLSENSESDLSEVGDSEFDFPTIKSRHPKSIDDALETASLLSYVYPSEPADLRGLGGNSRGVKGSEGVFDARYQKHRQTDFQPGRVFKILWSEPTSARSPGTQDGSSSKFYVGFRRFIIVATDDAGHSTCVPILTYERRACTKPGVNPNTHGIIYNPYGPLGNREPGLLKGEPELGFPPIRVDGYIDDVVLPKESRVNYVKLTTIEHNAKVFFIGFIPLEDFPKMVHAVNVCWEEGLRKAKQKTYGLTSSDTPRS